MMNPVLAVGAVAAPLVGGWALLRGVLRRGRRGAKEAGKEKAEAEGGVAFCCERVCTSEALLRRLGSLAKARGCALSTRATSRQLRLLSCSGPDAQHMRHGLRPLRCGGVHRGLPARGVQRNAQRACLERRLPAALRHRMP